MPEETDEKNPSHLYFTGIGVAMSLIRSGIEIYNIWEDAQEGKTEEERKALLLEIMEREDEEQVAARQRLVDSINSG